MSSVWIYRCIFKEDLVEYRASLLNMPDLPKWMYYRHPNGSDQAFLYGAPEEPGDVNIEVRFTIQIFDECKFY